MREEVAAALALAPRTAAHRLEVARSLAGPLADTAAVLEAGEISALAAMAVAEETAAVSDEVAAEVQVRVLPQAGRMAVSQLRRAVRRAVAVIDPATCERGHASAVEGRKVETWPESDGMATLAAWLPAPDVELVFHALDDAAARKGPDDPRGVDARRADVLVDWALAALDQTSGSVGSAPRPTMSVTVDLPTLLGLADSPGDLAGYGPIPASVARALAADGEWRRLVTDPLSGALLDRGRQTYTPSAALAEFLRARDATCRFPHCPVPAARCDLDHGIPWDSGGPTDRDNLGPLCRRHHRLKTHGGWRLVRSADASVTWVSPRGRKYVVPPTRIPPAA